MKRFISLMIALALALSACSVSFADDPDEAKGTVEMPYAGMRFTPPEAFRNTKGHIVTDGAIKLTAGIWYAYWVYCAMTEEELVAVNISGEGDDRATVLFDVFSIGDNMTFEDLNSMLYTPLPMEYVREIGKAGDVTFYLYSKGINQDYVSAIDEEYRDEYMALAGMADETAAAFAFYEPINKYAALIGTKVEFTTKDLNGNTVSSADLFAQNEITMVNVWATWCGYCIDELEELQQIHTRLQDQNCGVVGLLDDNKLETAIQLAADNGVTYPMIQAPDNMYDFFPMESYPSTFFVSRDGVILAMPVIGACVDRYEKTVNTLLGQQ